MRTLVYATLVALSTTALAEQPAVCNSPTLSPTIRAQKCIDTPSEAMPPVGSLKARSPVCQKPYINKLSPDIREDVCGSAKEIPASELTFFDPRCESDLYFKLPVATRRQIDCRIKRVSDFSPVCQNYLTGKLALPEDLRIEWCPDVPKIATGYGSPLVIIKRDDLQWRKDEAKRLYERGYTDGYWERNPSIGIDGEVERIFDF